MDTRHELSLDKEWRIGEDSFAALVDAFATLAPKVVVEYGSGVSSVRLALRLPGAEIHSVDHDPGYAAETRALQEAHGVKNLIVHLRPLRWQTHGGGLYQSYAPGELPPCIDAVVIDGPPYFVHLGREACLHQIVDRLRVGGVVVLDDCNRTVEQRAVENWLASYPESFERTDLAVGHGLCILVKRADSRLVMNRGVISANYRAGIARLTAALRTWWR